MDQAVTINHSGTLSPRPISGNHFKRGLYMLQAKLRSHIPASALSIHSRRFLGRYPVNFPDNRLYGTEFTLKQYMSWPDSEPLNAVIEHGLMCSDYSFAHYKGYQDKTLLVMSPMREDTLRRECPDWHVNSIGPYIHYAKSLLSPEKLARAKRKLGRNLLVFPAHSCNEVEISYETRDFLDFLAKLSKNYDTVTVCLHFIDYLSGRGNLFHKAGYRTITAGHMQDCFFLARLRSQIELADHTLSNMLGSHLAYCLCLGKPHWIYPQTIKYEFKDTECQKACSSMSVDHEMAITKAFGDNAEFAITPEHKEIYRYFMGGETLKNPQELTGILTAGRR